MINGSALQAKMQLNIKLQKSVLNSIGRQTSVKQFNIIKII